MTLKVPYSNEEQDVWTVSFETHASAISPSGKPWGYSWNRHCSLRLLPGQRIRTWLKWRSITCNRWRKTRCNAAKCFLRSWRRSASFIQARRRCWQSIRWKKKFLATSHHDMVPWAFGMKIDWSILITYISILDGYLIEDCAARLPRRVALRGNGS